MLYACPSCNRSSKNNLFPLAPGATSLALEEPPPGLEIPLLLDPSSIVNPIEHIIFKFESIYPPIAPFYWWARPRNNSIFGQKTIDVCDLNNSDLIELRNDYFDSTISPQINALERALKSHDVISIYNEFQRSINMLKSTNEFVGLTYDAFCFYIMNDALQHTIKQHWPPPHLIGL